MAVSFIYGKPGGGKSLYAFSLIIKELLEGSRPVITNLPVNPDRLNEWIQTKHPEKTVDLHSRLRLIDSDAIGQWWRWRGRDQWGHWKDLPEPAGDRGETDFRECPGPAFYVIDEVHTHFNARSWMKTGLAAVWYLSQHRKLGDDVVLISQTPAQVDKQLRSLSQEWLHLTNLTKLRAGYLFTLPQRILWRAYANQPGIGEPIMATGLLRIETPGWADCYDTARGNGIAGAANADKGTGKKGLPWWMAFVIPLTLLYGCSHMDKAIAFAVGRKTTAPTSTVQTVAGTPPLPPTNALSAPPQALPPVLAPPPPAPQPSTEPPVKVVGFAQIGHRITVWLSDGTKATPQTGLESWDGETAVIKGRPFRLD